MPAYDTLTVTLLRQIVNEAWASLPPEQRTRAYQSDLASRVLGLAATGERDPIKLKEAALRQDEIRLRP